MEYCDGFAHADFEDYEDPGEEVLDERLREEEEARYTPSILPMLVRQPANTLMQRRPDSLASWAQLSQLTPSTQTGSGLALSTPSAPAPTAAIEEESAPKRRRITGKGGRSTPNHGRSNAGEEASRSHDSPLEAQAPPRRRLRAKGVCQAAQWESKVMAQLLRDAMEAELADEDLPFLPRTVKRKYVHWTHVRTRNPQHVQPRAFTRAEFWNHMEKVYKEVYPEAESPTGSILMFGMVAKEQHKKASSTAQRDEHHHAPACCRQQHYWNKIAKVSIEKYNVPLNAVAHNSYLTMYAYLRRPTSKKPLSELDPEPFLSKWHPRGSQLVELLQSSKAAGRLLSARDVQGSKKRTRVSVFEEVQKHQLRTVVSLQAHAYSEFSAGRAGLAEFCSRQGHKLEDLIINAWSVIEAPQKQNSASETLLSKLASASKELPCECNGLWAHGALKILRRNGIDAGIFRDAVLEALRVGAK